MKFRIRKVEKDGTTSYYPQVKKNAFSTWENLLFYGYENNYEMLGRVVIAERYQSPFPFQSIQDAKKVISIFKSQQTQYKETFIYL